MILFLRLTQAYDIMAIMMIAISIIREASRFSSLIEEMMVRKVYALMISGKTSAIIRAPSSNTASPIAYINETLKILTMFTKRDVT